MSDANSKDQSPKVTGAKDRPWHMRAWSGISASGWWNALSRHKFRVSPTRVPMATILGGMSLLNSSMALLQRLFYSRRIAETELAAAPIFVLGHWRSGTTLLHELLVLDQSFTFPNTYACFCPNHFLISESWLKILVTFFLPKQRPMDNMKIGWNLPQEDEWALCNMGLPSPYFKVMFPNLPMVDHDYQTLKGLPADERRKWQQALLWLMKCLTIRERKRIVLKTPLHTFRVAAILEQFPNAKFIHISRDPFVLFPSTVHTWKRMYWHQALQVPKYEHLEEEVLQTFVEMFEAYDTDSRSIPPDQLYQLSYESLVDDPVAVLEQTYAHLQLPINAEVREAWNRYAANHKNYEKNRHQLARAQREAIVTRWRAYFDRYGYSTEAST